MNNPLVSVIIPAYNHELYIEASIDSVLAQTYKDIELILIDDGSKDSTWEKIQQKKPECDKRFSNVLFLTQNNQGTCITMQSLISHAKGKYVFFFSSDDLIKENAIEKEVNLMEADSSIVLAVGDNEFIDAKNNLLERDAKGNFMPYSSSSDNFKTFVPFLKNARADVDFSGHNFGSYETFIKGNYIPNGFLIRKSALDKIHPYTPEAPLEDYFLHLQLSKIGKYRFISEILFSYRIHGRNTIQNRAKMDEMSDKTLFYELKLLNSNPDLTEYKQKFDEILSKFSINFKFGPFVKRKNAFVSQFVFNFFGREIVLRVRARKKLPEWFDKRKGTL